MKDNKKGKKTFYRKPIPVAKIDPTTDEIIQVYKSLTAAAEDLKKAQVGNISRACQGKINTHKGYKWKYITSEELFEFEKKYQNN